MKRILCIAVLALSSGSAFAQLYVRANIGYNLPVNSQSLGSNYRQVYNTETSQYEISEEAVDGSFGSGLSFNLGVGGTINGALGYDIELGYLIGKEYSSQEYFSNGSYIDQYKRTMSSSSFQIAPALTFTAGTGNIQPYTRMGPVIAITKLKAEEAEYDTYSGIDDLYESEYTGGINLGFKGVLGVTFNSDKKLQFFGEASFISMSASPKKAELIAYTADGEDALDSIPEEQRTVKFKDKITSDDDGNVALRQKFSMGSLGFQVGIKYLLK